MGSLTGFTQREKSVEKEGVAGRGVIWLWLAWLDVSGVVGTVFFYPRPRQYSWQLSAHLLIPCLPLPWLSFCCRYPCQNVQQHKGSAGHTSHLWVRLKLKHATRCVLLTLSTCFSWIPLRNILPSLCFFFFFSILILLSLLPTFFFPSRVVWLPIWGWFIWTILPSLWESRHQWNGAHTYMHTDMGTWMFTRTENNPPSSIS